MKPFLVDIRRFAEETPSGSVPEMARSVLRGLLSPGFRALTVQRFFHWTRGKGVHTQPVRFLVERVVEISTGISIPASVDIGPGLRIHHFGGIMIHPEVKIGSRCTLYHGVTIGDDGLSSAAPCIGDDVLIGAGAKLLGGITLGNRCRVGANAVVLHSFPDDSILVGVPAHDVRRSVSPDHARQPDLGAGQ